MTLYSALAIVLVLACIMGAIWKFGEPGTARSIGLVAMIVLLVLFAILLVVPNGLMNTRIG